MKLASILENLPDGVIIVNRNKCTYFNKEASLMTKEKGES
jgi:PAS domain-containing protein